MAEQIMTLADVWINRIDDNPVAKMQDDAVAIVEECGEYVYIFEDGSSVYEKRQGDWYPASTYIQCSECDEYFNQSNATSNDNLCDPCVENRAQSKSVTKPQHGGASPHHI
jgi:formylmethanofuran dehydrogenase subunit E